jgi:hypothetical protein
VGTSIKKSAYIYTPLRLHFYVSFLKSVSTAGKFIMTFLIAFTNETTFQSILRGQLLEILCSCDWSVRKRANGWLKDPHPFPITQLLRVDSCV